MDPFDFIPIVPPPLPGERAARGPLEQVAAGVAVGLLPLANAALVLFTGLKGHEVIALIVMPVASAAIAYLLSRRLETPVGRSILFGFGCATGCLIGNLCAMILAAIGQFYSTF
jgi:hypothetical protein